MIAGSLLSFATSSPANATGTGTVIKEVKSSGIGGSEYRLNCPADSLIKGITAQAISWRGLNVISRAQASCNDIDTTGQSLTTKNKVLDFVGTATGGINQSAMCDKTSAVTGITVYTILEQSFVSGLKLQCGDLPLGGQNKDTSIMGYSSDTPQQLTCPQGSFASGLWVRYGEIIDSFGIRCAKIVDVTPGELTDVTLNATSKIYPYTQELSILSVGGVPDATKVSLTKVRDGSEGTGCSLDGTTLTATSAGVCTLEVTKAASGPYPAVSTTVDFTFIRADQNLTIEDLGTASKVSPFEQTLDIKLSGATGTGAVTFLVKDGTATGCALSDQTPQATLTAQTPGTCLVSAQIAEDSNFNAAISPDMTFTFAASESDLMAAELPPYDPKSEPEKVVDLQVAAFAALAVLSAGAGVASQTLAPRNSTMGRREDDDDNDSDSSSGDSDDSTQSDSHGRDSGDVASASAKKISIAKRSAAIGDLYGLWRFGHSPKIEHRFKNLIQKTSAYSPVLSRIFHDGAYLRAMFSSLSLLPSIAGAILGWFILKDTHFAALPPSTALFITAIGLATIDAFAGFLIATVYFLGTAVTGNIHSLDHFMTALGVAAIFMTPALMASAIRPLQRLVTNFATLWERLTDYLLAVLLGGWAIEKIISALNGLAGLQLPITAHAKQIGLIASLFIFIRMVLEEVATYFFPERLADQEAHGEELKPLHPWYSLLFKTALFFAVSYQFLTINQQLILGTIIFALPQIVTNVTEHFSIRKTSMLGLLLPKGAPKMVVMIFIGGFFANWIQSLFSTPQEFMTWSFVVLALPGLILGLAGIFAVAPKKDWKKHSVGQFVYRCGGIAIAALIIAIYRGVDLYHLVFPS